jgi:hypothetical protein
VLPELEAEIGHHGLHVFTSHEVLRISPHAEFHKWAQDDLISIVPDECRMARVFFQKKDDVDKVTVLFGNSGTLMEYPSLASALSPHFKRLAENKTG